MRDCPELGERLDRYRQAFWALSPSRHAGTTLGRIPFGPVDRYAARYGIEDFDAFHTLIQAMDTAFLDHGNTDARKGGGHVGADGGS